MATDSQTETEAEMNSGTERTEDGGTESEGEAETADPWDVEVLRDLLPDLGSEGTRAAICAIRNPDASALQIAVKCGLSSNYTVYNALRRLLVDAGDDRADVANTYEVRGGNRDAESYGELTEKQTAVIDFAAEHPTFVADHQYGDVSQAIQEKMDVTVGETYVGKVLRKYREILHRRRAQVASEDETEPDLDDLASDLTVRETLAAAGYDLPAENLDEMPEVESDSSYGSPQNTAPGNAEQAAAEFKRASEVAGEESNPGATTFFDEAWLEQHSPRPGAENAVRLPDDAEDEDVKQNTPYWAYVNNIERYGVFVSLTDPPHGNDVSGLVKEEQLYGTPDQCERGDPMIVELDYRSAKGLSFTDWRHAHPDQMASQTATDEAESEAEAEATDHEQDGPEQPATADRLERQSERDEPTAEERVAALERAVDTLREDAVLASEVREFADEVEDRLETVERSMQNSFKAETQEQAEQNAERLATLQEAVNALGEEVEQATSLDDTLGRVQRDLHRLEAEGATVDSYSFQQQDGTVTVHLQADLGQPHAGEPMPKCYQCGAALGELWRDAQEMAKEDRTAPAACTHCGENPLPPVGGQQATTDPDDEDHEDLL